MFFLKKEKINRVEKRLISKLKSPEFYKNILNIFQLFFSVKKIFLIVWKNNIKKIIWIISISIFSIFWLKFSFIDDFFINKKNRWKTFWKKLFEKSVENIKKYKSDFIFLITDKKRKKSHKFYVKSWFTLVSFWLFFLAFKKIKNKF